jgi:hypothetical protein
VLHCASHIKNAGMNIKIKINTNVSSAVLKIEMDELTTSVAEQKEKELVQK